MSDRNESEARKKCLYIFRQGKRVGTQCSYFVSKKDPKKLQCSQHYHRYHPPVPEISLVEPTPIVVVKEETPDVDSEDEEFEKRFLEERERAGREIEHLKQRLVQKKKADRRIKYCLSREEADPVFKEWKKLTDEIHGHN